MDNVSVVKEMVSYMKQTIQDLDQLSDEQEVKNTVKVISKLKFCSH